MDDHMVKGHILAKKAENKLHACCPLFGSKVEDAALLFHKSATSFKLAKSCRILSLTRNLFQNFFFSFSCFSHTFNCFFVRSGDKAGSLFVESSACHMKLGNKHDAVNAYIEGARCYKKTSLQGAVFCLNKVVTIYEELGRHIMAAKYSKEIGDLCELNKDIDCARLHYERAAELFEIGDAATSVIQCKLKVAQFFVQLQQYQKAIKIYEDIARQSLNSNLLKYGVRVHLLNSGLCQLVKGDFVAISNSLELYQDLDPTFSTTREYKFLADLAASIDEEDVEKFTKVVKEFNDITPLGL
ncbi:alpha-soluble NSF attachment protein 2 isoform X2 [Vigna radiata var. radiata]|uniref:Alpha-soluble NSF attachment protein 2 isoform X2 n=1 Tax=Vigna radiata var. radiata TaxID=3916 RepID=A0A1S3TX40_VIGRR|nr:alpha-soluble NSF attachment protein 2 isoform X2 [Vigna radiata var. radiata]